MDNLNPAQARFFRSFDPSAHILFCTGVGIGKTYALALAACLLAEMNPGVNGLIVSHVLNHVRTEIVPLVVAQLAASDLYAGETKMDRTIHLTHGGAIQYGSAEKPSTLDGKNVGWLLGDEVRYWPRQSYEKATARVRVIDARYPMQAFTSTPEMNWIYDEFADREDRIVVHGVTSENADNLQSGYYDRLAASLAPGTFSQYVEGQWVSSTGSVYGAEFGRDATIDDLEWIPGVPVVMGMDPGMLAPAIIFAQRLDLCQQHGCLDCLHIIGELVPNETPLVRLIPMIRDLAGRSGWQLGTLYLDPFGGNAREQLYGSTVAEKLEEAGFDVDFTYDHASTNILNGIAAVQSRLLNMAGERRLYISRSLDGHGLTSRNICRAIQSYRWPERQPGQAVKSNPIHDETSHVMDALRYLVINIWPPVIGGVKVV